MRATLLRAAVLAALQAAFALPSAVATSALEWSDNDLYIRVVDVGQGLCALSVIPGGHMMIYDAGHWLGQNCLEAVLELVPQDSGVDLMVISHSDADHLGDAAAIIEAVDLAEFLDTGDERPDGVAWTNMMNALETEGAHEIHLGQDVLQPGKQFHLGAATVTFVAGWREWTATSLDNAERLNAISIVVKLEFGGRTVLFTGDTIGRRLNDANSACKDAEKAMVDNASVVPLKADVMTAPHHGGDNGSSNCFIAAVDPTYVIFSAGRTYRHPTQGAADRYLAQGVLPTNMFRTDRGDDEPGSTGKIKQWVFGAIAGCMDKRGDDDVEIVISAAGELQVDYRVHSQGC